MEQIGVRLMEELISHWKEMLMSDGEMKRVLAMVDVIEGAIGMAVVDFLGEDEIGLVEDEFRGSVSFGIRHAFDGVQGRPRVDCTDNE